MSTTFVVSLYLPYTVDFHDLLTPARRPSPIRQPSRVDSLTDSKDKDKKPSLFNVQTPPRTPVPNDSERFFALQPSAATHFPTPQNPRGLVRSDSHVPDWGSNVFFNQPRSRAAPPPPDTILEYAKVQVERAQQKLSSMQKLPLRPTTRSRDSSTDKGAIGSQSQWSVVPAVLGNGGLANAIRSCHDGGQLGDYQWVGTLGFPTDALEEQTRESISENLESEHDSLTVYISDSDFDGSYVHYCKMILWPVFHYQIPDHPKSKAYEDHSWIFYVHMNEAFAERIVQGYKRGDIIWVHDYHLLLVPAMVRKKLPDAQIGFFLHTAFPSSEVFRCLAARKELLEGMLGANLVAFQTREYAHHFLQTCSRLLSVEATECGIQLDQRFVNVTHTPIGIDPQGLDVLRDQPEVLEWINVMQERYKGKKLIVARDKLDNIRGVRQKLLAFELFLNKYPEWREKVVMIQVASATTENADLAATVTDIVTRIDSVHSTLAHQPLVFLRQDIAFSQYLALLSVADVLMITCLREGMNLTPHEFVICQDGKAGDKKHGPVILSEFTGSAAIFDNSELSVNPWDYQSCANAIKSALEMDESEKDQRYNCMKNIVMKRTGEFWCKDLQDQLANVYEEHYRRDTMSVPRLSTSQLTEKFKNATKRVFVLDYEGTLATYGSVKSAVISSPQRVLDALNDLLVDDRNLVYIMSGRTPEELQMIFSRVPGIGLIAENGCFLREFGSDEWLEFADPDQVSAWKSGLKGILKYYQERAKGSWIEERHCSMLFHYEQAEDLEGAKNLAGDCANQINDVGQTQRVRAVPTKGCVVIEPQDWDKGTAATHILENLHRKAGEKGVVADFLFVAGNDRDDEVIFRWANELGSQGVIKEVTTVNVGKRNTEATATLTQGTTGLVNVLQRLGKLSFS